MCKSQIFDVINGLRAKPVSLVLDPAYPDNNLEITREFTTPSPVFTLTNPAEGEPEEFTFKLVIHPGRMVTIEMGVDETLFVQSGTNWTEAVSTAVTGFKLLTVSRVYNSLTLRHEWYVHTEG